MMQRFFRGSATRDNGNSSPETPSLPPSRSSTPSSSTSSPPEKFRLDPEALASLQLVKDIIGVVSVCGRARQGKSFILNQDKASQPVTKEELGRSTWTFLHTLAAQYPEHPSRQQKKDVKELMAILSRMYPCKECADHFKEVLRSNPVQAGSQAEFSQWLCHVHNVVNRSLGKPIFLCDRVDARWGKLDCEKRMCDLQGTTSFGEDL